MTDFDTTGVDAPDFDATARYLQQAVPFVRTLNLEFVELSAGRAVLRLPDDPAVHNHVGGPHAGALFTLGESATGAVVIGSFGDLLGTHTPLAYGAQIRYWALARGPVTAEATLPTTAAQIRETLATEGKARFDVPVVLRNAAGAMTAEMTVTWALRPNA